MGKSGLECEHVKEVVERSFSMKPVMKASVALVASLLCSCESNAQAVCGERTAIVTALESGHQEQKAGQGLSGNGGIVELFASGKGSWTMLITFPKGPTCLLGAGEGWEGWVPETPEKTTPEVKHGEPKHT
jgi:hypothetical protein